MLVFLSLRSAGASPNGATRTPRYPGRVPERFSDQAVPLMAVVWPSHAGAVSSSLMTDGYEIIPGLLMTGLVRGHVGEAIVMERRLH